MRNFALPLALSLVASSAAAQCFDTAFGTPLGVPGSLFGDVVFPQQSIGFAFPLGGATYTDIHVCDKGYVYLSNAGVPAPGGADFDASGADLVSGSPRVCALWSDIQVLSSNNGQVYLKSSPTTCTITWENAQCYQATSGVFSMQMELSVSGQVKVLFGPGTTNNSNAMQPTWQVGIAGLSPGMGATLPAASDLSAGGASTDNTVFEEWTTPNTFDIANNGLLFIPTSPTGYTFVPLGSPVNCASTSVFGTGCVQSNDSVYEEWTSGFDLNNTTITWLRSPSGYLVFNSIPGTFVPPSGAAINIAAGQLDGSQTVALTGAMPIPGGTTSSLGITTKGTIEFTANPPTIDFTPSPAELLANPNTTVGLWHDYDQTSPGSGLIQYEQVGNIAYATWNGVHSFSSTTPSTFQFQFDVATGNITLVINTMGGFAAPDSGVLGFSVGGPSNDPGATDFSAITGTVEVADFGSTGVKLTTNSAPAFGNAGFAFVVSDIPNLVPVGIQFFGTASVNPGLDLTFLGMAGCFAYTNANLGSVTFPIVSGVGTIGLPIPSNPALLGVVLSSQSAVFTTATAFGLATSNGVEITVGN